MNVINQLERHLRERDDFGATMGGFSYYASLTSRYSDDLMGQFLHIPVFALPPLEHPKELPVDITIWHQCNAQGEVPSLKELTKINPKAEKITKDPLYAHIPAFPDIFIRPSSLGDTYSFFTKTWLNSSQASGFCDVYKDQKSSVYVVLKPVALIYYTRALLAMKLDTEKDVANMYNRAKEIRACASLAGNNLSIFSHTEGIDMKQFRKDVAKNGPYRATMLDVGELNTFRMIMDTLGPSTGFTLMEERNCWFVGWLLSEWMSLAHAIADSIIAMVEDSSES